MGCVANTIPVDEIGFRIDPPYRACGRPVACDIGDDCFCEQHALEHPAGVIVDEEYERGVPGRACLLCDSAWPATEPDDEPWHHGGNCPKGKR